MDNRYWRVIGWIGGFAAGLGGFMWIANQLFIVFGESSTLRGADGTSFTIAQLSATVGGFVLVGGILNSGSEAIRKPLLKAAKALFVSVLAYSVLGLVLPMYGMLVTEPAPTELSGKAFYYLAGIAVVFTFPFATFAGPIGLGVGVGSMLASLGRISSLR